MITQSAISSVVEHIADEITSAKYRIGTTWHTASVTTAAQTQIGRAMVMFTMTGSVGQTVNAVEIYAGNVLWGHKDVSIRFETGYTTIYYVYGIPVAEVLENGV